MIILKMDLSDPMGNRKTLKVRENEYGELRYSMTGKGGTSYSLNNLQLKDELPTWRDEPMSLFVIELRRIIEQGVYRQLSYQLPPQKRAAQ